VLGCALAIIGVASIQHTVIIGMDVRELHPANFLIPTGVGSFFGTLIVIVWRYRADLAARNAELEAERRRTEELLREVADLAAERGHMVEQAYEALAAAERAAMAGQIAGQAAHDLNNLLSVMMSGIELADEGILRQDDVESMRVAGRRSAALVQRMLAMVRRRTLHHPEMVDVARTMEELRPVLERLVRDGQVLSLEATTAMAWVDPFDLELSVLNLVANARDAAEKGPIRVAVTTLPDHVQVDVVDEGPGMTEAQLARAMKPLFSTKGAKGTGLGLAIVQEAMEACEGTVELLSTAGEGTTARLTLWAQPPDSAETPMVH